MRAASPAWQPRAEPPPRAPRHPCGPRRRTGAPPPGGGRDPGAAARCRGTGQLLPRTPRRSPPAPPGPGPAAPGPAPPPRRASTPQRPLRAVGKALPPSAAHTHASPSHTHTRTHTQTGTEPPRRREDSGNETSSQRLGNANSPRYPGR